MRLAFDALLTDTLSECPTAETSFEELKLQAEHIKRTLTFNRSSQDSNNFGYVKARTNLNKLIEKLSKQPLSYARSRQMNEVHLLLSVIEQKIDFDQTITALSEMTDKKKPQKK